MKILLAIIAGSAFYFGCLWFAKKYSVLGVFGAVVTTSVTLWLLG